MAEVPTKLSTDQKIARFREAYAAFNRRDLEKAHEVYADDVIWHGVVQDIRGRQALIDSAHDVLRGVEDLKFESHAILADDDHVVSLMNLTIRQKGQTIAARGVEVYHLDESGKIKEGWAHYDAEKLKQALGDHA